MDQLDQSVERVVTFLRKQKYTASTVCVHRKCYSELRTHLSKAGLGYSFKAALDWIKQESEHWERRKSANYRHFIVHLDDMDRLGRIPADHLSYHFPPFTRLSGTLVKELGLFLDSIETENTRENMRKR